MLKNDITQLLEREMDRKGFLKHLGAAVIALTGVTALINSLAKQPTNQAGQAFGYGDGAYGGKKNS